MQITQGDRGMVRMANTAPCIDPRIASLYLPWPARCFPVLLDHVPILPLGHTVRPFGADINDFTCHTIDLLHDVIRIHRVQFLVSTQNASAEIRISISQPDGFESDDLVYSSFERAIDSDSGELGA